MAGHHREIDPSIPGREQAARRAGRSEAPIADATEAEFMVRPLDRLGGGRPGGAGDLPDLNPEEILAWADAYHVARGGGRDGTRGRSRRRPARPG